MVRVFAASTALFPVEEGVVEVAQSLLRQGFRPGRGDATALVFATFPHIKKPLAFCRVLQDILGDTPYLGWIGSHLYHMQGNHTCYAWLGILILQNTYGTVRTAPLGTVGYPSAASLMADNLRGQVRFLSGQSSIGHMDEVGVAAALADADAPLFGSWNTGMLPFSDDIASQAAQAAQTAKQAAKNAAQYDDAKHHKQDPRQDPRNAARIKKIQPSHRAALLAPHMQNVPSAGLLTIDGCYAVGAVASAISPVGPSRYVRQLDQRKLVLLDDNHAADAFAIDKQIVDSHDEKLSLSLTQSPYVYLHDHNRNFLTLQPVSHIDTDHGEVHMPQLSLRSCDAAFAAWDESIASSYLDASLLELAQSVAGHTPAALVSFAPGPTQFANEKEQFVQNSHDLQRLSSLLGGYQTPIFSLSCAQQIGTVEGYVHMLTRSHSVVAILDEKPRPKIDWALVT